MNFHYRNERKSCHAPSPADPQLSDHAHLWPGGGTAGDGRGGSCRQRSGVSKYFSPTKGLNILLHRCRCSARTGRRTSTSRRRACRASWAQASYPGGRSCSPSGPPIAGLQHILSPWKLGTLHLTLYKKSRNTVVVIRNWTPSFPIFSTKSWSNWLPTDSFEICLPWEHCLHA